VAGAYTVYLCTGELSGIMVNTTESNITYQVTTTAVSVAGACTVYLCTGQLASSVFFQRVVATGHKQCRISQLPCGVARGAKALSANLATVSVLQSCCNNTAAADVI
jgi:hypothetical protein